MTATTTIAVYTTLHTYNIQKSIKNFVGLFPFFSFFSSLLRQNHAFFVIFKDFFLFNFHE